MGSMLYPIDADYIMQKKRAILREMKQKDGLIAKKVAIFSGSTIGEIQPVLNLFLMDMGIEPEFYVGGYGRFYEDLVFDDGSVAEFAPDVIYIHTTVKNLNFPPFDADEQYVTRYAVNEFQRFKTAIEAAKSFGCAVICNNFELPPYRPAGNAEVRFAGGNVRFVNRMNTMLCEFAADNNVFINDINYLSALYGLDRWYDETVWYAYKYAFSLGAIPHLCYNLSTIVGAIYGKSKKSIILDLDNTLWGGVIGDDGAEGIEIGNESPLGMAHLELCKFALRLKEQGVMLAVCSKNEHDVAMTGFERDEMPMKNEDFVSIKANWNPKSDNINELLSEMNITADSAVFVDDNPAEREIVSGQIDGITVPEMLQIDSIVRKIDRQNMFEVALLTQDDKKRTDFLRSNLERSKRENSFADYSEYLKSLEMSAKIQPVTDGNLERVTQLVNKTNQFNLTTKRYTESQVSQLVDDKESITLCASLSDKFGDNGIVSVLFARLDSESKVCDIELFIMSCRVFKRELEFAVIDTLVNALKARDISVANGIYIPTAKNKPCADFYEKAGFSVKSSSQEKTEFELDITTYQQKSHFIDIESTI